MEPFKQRVAEEHEQLSARIVKLVAFKDSPAFRSLPLPEQRRLRHQLVHMDGYEEALVERMQALDIPRRFAI